MGQTFSPQYTAAYRRSVHPYFNVLGVLVFTSILAMVLAQAESQRLESLLYLGRWVPLGLLTVYAVGQWALAPRWRGPAIRRLKGVDGWALSWLLLLYASTVYSVAPETTLTIATTFFLGYVAVFWGVWGYADQFGEERALKLLLVVLSLILLASWISWAGGLGRTLSAQFVGGQSGGIIISSRFRGVLENPNSLGLLTAFTVPVLLGYALKIGNKYIYGILGISIITLLYTGNRSGIGASTVACGYIMWKEGKSKKGLIAFILVVLLVAGYGLRGQVEALILRTETLDTGSRRTFIWEAFFEYIRNRPFLGHGWGTEDLLHDYYGSNVVAKYHTRISLAASGYIGYAAQVGLLGAAMFFLPLIWLAGHVALIPRGHQFGAHVLNSVLIAGLITATVSSWMTSLGNAQSLFFWIPVMLLVRRRVRARTQRRKQVAASRASPRTSRR